MQLVLSVSRLDSGVILDALTNSTRNFVTGDRVVFRLRIADEVKIREGNIIYINYGNASVEWRNKVATISICDLLSVVR